MFWEPEHKCFPQINTLEKRNDSSAEPPQADIKNLQKAFLPSITSP